MNPLDVIATALSLLCAAIVAWLICSALAQPAHAEPPVSLPRPAATQPATPRSVETIQRVYYTDGSVREKSLGIVTLLQSDTFANP